MQLNSDGDKHLPVSDVELDDFFARVQHHLGSQYVPVSIALADPWVRQILLGFEDMPRNQGEREALIRWRLSKEWQLDPEHISLSWQYLGEQGGQHTVLAQTIDKEILDSLLRQLRQRKLMLLGIDSIGNYLFKHLQRHDRVLFIHLQPDYWTLYVTNELGWPIYRRSKWQTAPDSEPGIRAFTAQLERSIVSVMPESFNDIIIASDNILLQEIAEDIGQRLAVRPSFLPWVQCNTVGDLQPGDSLAIQVQGQA